MNKRIRELIEQAETREVGYYYFDREKFIESLVKDVIRDIEKIKLQLQHEADGDYDDGYVNGLSRSQAILKNLL